MDKDLIELEKFLDDQANLTETLKSFYVRLTHEEFSDEVKDAVIESWYSTVH